MPYRSLYHSLNALDFMLNFTYKEERFAIPPAAFQGKHRSVSSQKHQGRSSKIIGVPTWGYLQEWLQQALDVVRADPPDHCLLLPTLPETPQPPTIEGTGDDQFFNIPFNKPKNEGITHRAYDPEAMFIVGIAHVVGGCNWGIGPYGSSQRYYYYERVKFPGKNRRPYLIRIIVGTDAGLLTKENREDFHDHRRKALGDMVKQVDPRDPTARYGREALTEWTVEELRKAIESGVEASITSTG